MIPAQVTVQKYIILTCGSFIHTPAPSIHAGDVGVLPGVASRIVTISESLSTGRFIPLYCRLLKYRVADRQTTHVRFPWGVS